MYIYLEGDLVPGEMCAAAPYSARAGKVGDRIEARLGPPLFVFSGFNFSNILFRSLIYRWTPIPFTPWCATLSFIS